MNPILRNGLLSSQKRHLRLGTVFLVLGMLFQPITSEANEIRVPAFTAYISPDSEGASVTEQQGVTQWTDAKQSVNWYGKFEKAGACSAKVELVLPKDTTSKLRLTINNRSQEVLVKRMEDQEVCVADFGAFSIASKGYHRIQLESLNKGTDAGNVKALVIEGEAAMDAHFNLKERRNAASVHLAYPVPTGIDVAAFYSEVTAIEDPTTTFYMACGWHRGYFGMQVNSTEERRIIFSVWDSGDEAVERKNVVDENRVKLISKGNGVYSGDFGNEGTGGHSHLKYLWKTGEKQRFVVTAEPKDKTFTVFSGFWFHPEQKDWMLISSWKAPKEGGWLKGLHGFSENFGGSNGDRLRKALYGNQWIKSSKGKWIELTQASFSHDPTGQSDRFDRYMGIEGGQFFLSHGGFVDGFSKFGDEFTREPIRNPPSIPNR